MPGRRVAAGSQMSCAPTKRTAIPASGVTSGAAFPAGK